MKVPFIIYVDTKSLLKKIDTSQSNLKSHQLLK